MHRALTFVQLPHPTTTTANIAIAKSACPTRDEISKLKTIFDKVDVFTMQQAVRGFDGQNTVSIENILKILCNHILSMSIT